MQISIRDATVWIKDGAGNSIEVRVGTGNITYTEARTIEYTLDRGRLDEVRQGDDVPVDVSFDFIWEYLLGPSVASGSGGTPTIEDALKKRGGAAEWTSSDSDTCRPYAVDIVIDHIPDCETGDRETITIEDYRWESLNHSLREGTVSSSGKANVVQASISRSART